ncbi:DUF502 domain-containing protein [Candidatus Bipolaricaulota bacterium]|nr:DUF502 domain-containing protein [Candidatus Bipolaricaulota bacterium]
MKKFLLWLRTIFVSGLLAILPVGATVYILLLLYRMIDRFVGKNTPFGLTIERAMGRWVPGLGIVITILLIFLIGFVVRSVLGRGLHYYFERIFFWFPGVRKMYGTLKQFTHALLNRSSTSSFQQVVMFEYPKEGINVLGMVTNENLGKLQDATGEDCVLVYTPTAPNPLSGYMLIIPKRLLTYIDMPVEDALSMVVSSGSALPDSLRTTQIVEGKDNKRSWMSPFRKRS